MRGKSKKKQKAKPKNKKPLSNLRHTLNINILKPFLPPNPTKAFPDIPSINPPDNTAYHPQVPTNGSEG